MQDNKPLVVGLAGFGTVGGGLLLGGGVGSRPDGQLLRSVGPLVRPGRALRLLGTVGGGLCRLLRENADLVRRRCGRDIRIKTILVRNANKIREVETPAGAALVEDAAKIYADPEIDVVCELMGGIKPAKDLIDKALEHGKDIVSANKALLAEDGLGLFRKARKLGRALRYEASVAGAIPIVEILRESMSGNRITSLIGILNGTSNYILWEMTAGAWILRQPFSRPMILAMPRLTPLWT